VRSPEQIQAALLGYEPEAVPEDKQPPSQAAVALILHPHGPSGTEVLLIERAKRQGDPWSGDMAFPGGRRESLDADLAMTASRETHEEVGVRLPPPLGHLDDIHRHQNPRIPTFLLRPYVYLLPERPSVVPNYEVASTVWIPLSRIYDPDSWTDFVLQRDGVDVAENRFPAFVYEGYTVWGLTFRMLRNFGQLLELSLPDSSS